MRHRARPNKILRRPISQAFRRLRRQRASHRHRKLTVSRPHRRQMVSHLLRRQRASRQLRRQRVSHRRRKLTVFRPHRRQRVSHSNRRPCHKPNRRSFPSLLKTNSLTSLFYFRRLILLFRRRLQSMSKTIFPPAPPFSSRVCASTMSPSLKTRLRSGRNRCARMRPNIRSITSCVG